MSEIRANTISDAAGTGPATLTGQSAAKAWVQCDTSGAIVGSYNIASFTDVSVGRYEYSFTNNLISANDGASVGAARSGVPIDEIASTNFGPNTLELNLYDASGSGAVDGNGYAAMFGDLA